MRTIDLVAGVPLMAIDPLSRRLGDRLGGTLVVHDRPLEAGPVLGRVPPGWGARELAVWRASSSAPGPWRTRRWCGGWRSASSTASGATLPTCSRASIPAADPVAAIRQALQVEEG